jgi:hypothetical protein
MALVGALNVARLRLRFDWRNLTKNSTWLQLSHFSTDSLTLSLLHVTSSTLCSFGRSCLTVRCDLAFCVRSRGPAHSSKVGACVPPAFPRAVSAVPSLWRGCGFPEPGSLAPAASASGRSRQVESSSERRARADSDAPVRRRTVDRRRTTSVQTRESASDCSGASSMGTLRHRYVHSQAIELPDELWFRAN